MDIFMAVYIAITIAVILFLILCEFKLRNENRQVPAEPLKIYLDDIRATPEGWTRCNKVEEVQELLRNNVVTNMSLDHDLGASYLCPNCYEMGCSRPECQDGQLCGCDCHNQTPLEYPTGYDLVKWMAENDYWSVYPPTVHSANPAGRVNMQAVIDRYWHGPNEPRRF